MSSITSEPLMKYRLGDEVFNVQIKHSLYKQGNQTALQLVEEDGMPFATCTVNMPGQLEHGEVAVKSYSENEGMLEFLVTNNIVEPPHRHIFSSYAKFPVCRLK